ncbi:MAG: hypothetical protein IV090_19570 [Candidatus Sericytochromatia bacterium]|jgi:hypothetical protein|nr:hypothetical protein [Candidatus Sericytochromatia bacterium]
MYPLDAFVSQENKLKQQRQARELQFQALIDEAKLAFLDFCDFKGRSGNSHPLQGIGMKRATAL